MPSPDKGKYEQVLRAKLYIAKDEESIAMPKVELVPHSLVEFIIEHVPEFVLWWPDGCFGVISGGVLYWSCVQGVAPALGKLFKFYEIAGADMDKIRGTNFEILSQILMSLSLSNVNELFEQKDIINYALELGLLQMEVNGYTVDSFDSLIEYLLERNIDESSINVKLPLVQIKRCMQEGIPTYDECLMKRRFGLVLEDYPLLKKLSTLFSALDDAELLEAPERDGSRIVIGLRGYSEPVYLEELFPKLAEYPRLKEFIENYSNEKTGTYDEFLLSIEKGYTMQSFEELIAQGLVSVKLNGKEDKIKRYRIGEGHIILDGVSGNKYSLRETIRRKSLKMPLSVSYKKYLTRKKDYEYYVVWKMADNVKYSSLRAPANLEELRKFAHLGLLKADGKVVRDVIADGKELFFAFEDGSRREMYHYVAPQNRFEIYGMINNNLDWIRRFIAEGYREKNALRLAISLKKYELGKKKRKLSVQELSSELDVSVELLEIYLRSDLFKRFGELHNGYFYIHPDINEFKKNVQVNRSKNYEVIVVDGRNVMYGGEEKDSKKGRVQRILTVLDYLMKQGVPKERIIVIVKNSDFNPHRVDDVEKLRELEREELIKPVSNDYDDKVILRIALEEKNGLIITNDNYREFVGDNILREDIDSRLLNFTFRGKNFHIKREHRSKFDSFLERMVQSKVQEESKKSE